MDRFPVAVLLTLAAVAAAPAPRAQTEGGPVTEADVRKFESWLDAYSKGQIRLLKRGRVDLRAVRTYEELFEKIASGQDVVAARRLWQAAVIDLPAEIEQHDRLAAMLGSVHGKAKTLLASIHAPGVDEWLIEVALRKGGRDADIYRMTALEVIGLRERPEAGKLLLEKLSSFPIPERIQAVLALERTGTLEAIPELIKLFKIAEPNLRIATVQAITGILAPYSDETREANVAGGTEGEKWTPIVVEELRKVMQRDRVWQVRQAVCDGLLRLKTRLAIPVLIQGLRHELSSSSWSNTMVAISYHEALERLTGQDLPENAPKLWEDFWAKEGAAFRFATIEQKQKPNPNQAAGSVQYARYFDLDLKSKRVLFVIDFSGSMAEKVWLSERYGSQAQHVKYELVRKELEKVVRGLPRDTICNIVFFNDRVSVWRSDRNGKPALVKMTDDNKSDLLQYIWGTAPSGATNVYGALRLALSMGDRGVFDKNYGAAYDTIFLLSDGAPSAGETIDTGEIRERVRSINKLRRIKIHTIVFGDEMNNLKFLEELAKENGGRFMHVR